MPEKMRVLMNGDEAYRRIVDVLEEIGFVGDDVKDSVEEIISVVEESNS
jgi:hypothetical protein